MKKKPEEIVRAVARKLVGISLTDLTTAERGIADTLQEAHYLYYERKHGEITIKEMK